MDYGVIGIPNNRSGVRDRINSILDEVTGIPFGPNGTSDRPEAIPAGVNGVLVHTARLADEAKA